MGSPAVLLVFLALGLEGVPTLASSQYCPISSDVVVPAGNVVLVYHEEISGAKNMSATLFLQPLSDFEGISVEASFATDTLAAWFPTDQCCSGTPHTLKWIPLKVEVEVIIHFFSVKPGYYYHYLMNFGGCVKKCEKRFSISLDAVENLKIIAHGSSRWKCSSPPNASLTSCNNTIDTITCPKPSTPTLTTTPIPTAKPTSFVWCTSANTADDKYYTSLPSTVMVTIAHILVAVDIMIIVAVMAALIPQMRQRAYNC